MNFKKIISFILLLSISFSNSQCMEDKTRSTYKTFPGLNLFEPSFPYLIKKYKFCHSIMNELYDKYFSYYKKNKNIQKYDDKSIDDFRLKLIRFLNCYFYFNKKLNKDLTLDFTINKCFDEGLSFNSLAIDFMRICFNGNVGIITNKKNKLIKEWDDFLKIILNQ